MKQWALLKFLLLLQHGLHSYLGSPGGNSCEYNGCYSPDPADYFDEEAFSQIEENLNDITWSMESVKDSTNNPCIANALFTLASIDTALPKLIRSFFGASPNINLTFKMYSNPNWNTAIFPPGAPPGAIQNQNLTTNNFVININGYYENTTDLGFAATIIHETFHSYIMNQFRLAHMINDSATKIFIAVNFGSIFTREIIALDSALSLVIDGGNPAQHQYMLERYQSSIAQSLRQFALSKGINISLDYCRDLAFTGCFDSRAFLNLSPGDRDRIKDRVNAEKDPYSNLMDPTNNYGLNINGVAPKGTPCP